MRISVQLSLCTCIVHPVMLALPVLARTRQPANNCCRYGYMKEKFIFSLISAVGVFCIGAGASVINGAYALTDQGNTPHPPQSSTCFPISMSLQGSHAPCGPTVNTVFVLSVHL